MEKVRAGLSARAALMVWSAVSVAAHVGALLAMHPGAAAASAPRGQAAIELIPLPSHVLDGSSTQGGAPDQELAPRKSIPTPPSVDQERGGKIETDAALAEPEYLISSQLSQRPVVLGTIEVPYPEIKPEGGEVKVVLTLYINERGIVDRVEVDDASVPAPFADAARRAFLLATFTPGRVHDQAVRSQLQIEVNFNAGAPGSEAPAN